MADAATKSIDMANVSLVPRPRPAFRRLHYGKAGRA